MSYRKSLDAKREDDRWYRVVHKRTGEVQWRRKADEVTGAVFNRRACRQQPGFARGARIKQNW